jgi:ESCRT-II complex subunit VPS22
MRRGQVGIGGMKKNTGAGFSALGKKMQDEKLSTISATLQSFKEALVEFATKYRDRINSDPEFRMQFHRMCVSMGVDPLASRKGFWSEILGVSDFYFEMGVVIVEICVQTRASNGGLLCMSELLERVNVQAKSQRKKLADITDVQRSIEKLAVLGGGFRVINIGCQAYVASTPVEINTDHRVLLECAQSLGGGGITASLLKRRAGWTEERFSLVITPLLFEGILWVDMHAGPTRVGSRDRDGDGDCESGEPSYEFPTISLGLCLGLSPKGDAHVPDHDDDPPPPYEE